MLQVDSLDPGDPLAVVSDFGPGFHQRVEDHIPIEVDN